MASDRAKIKYEMWNVTCLRERMVKKMLYTKVSLNSKLEW